MLPEDIRGVKQHDNLYLIIDNDTSITAERFVLTLSKLFLVNFNYCPENSMISLIGNNNINRNIIDYLLDGEKRVRLTAKNMESDIENLYTLLNVIEYTEKCAKEYGDKLRALFFFNISGCGWVSSFADKISRDYPIFVICRSPVSPQFNRHDDKLRIFANV